MRSPGECRRRSGEGAAGPEVPRGWSRGRRGRGARYAVAAPMGPCRHLGLRRLSVSRLPHPGETGLDLETKRRSLELLRQVRLWVTFLLLAVKPAAASRAECWDGSRHGSRGRGHSDCCLQQGHKKLCTVVGRSRLGNRCSFKTT